ncbi:lipase secretion chaperone [Janthinobacterium sp.]|uniref:lipase secretion chaperone n=1 Tax=Janthinobacterium sp. TaxID=1871054 RepID=UPI00293D4B91|nr:lipase secretion chaperone [Janthinobacterium sp.]
MKTNAKLLGFGAGALALGALYFSLNRPDAPAPAARREADYFAFVPSMAGTRPDGDIKLDGGEQLRVDAELGHLFDYYLAGLGEKSLEAITSEIERELERRLTAAPAAAAKRLLARYLAYKRALAGIEPGLPPTRDLAQAARARLSAMQALRLQHFSAAESAGLFGFSDAYDADAIARIEIEQDSALDAAQKRQKLAALDARLPAALREERAAPRRVLDIEEAARKMRADGAGDNAVYAMRAGALSAGAAARLADLDREEAAWKGRIDAYLAERAKLAATAPPQELQALRDARFKPEEQKRLPAYE